MRPISPQKHNKDNVLKTPKFNYRPQSRWVHNKISLVFIMNSPFKGHQPSSTTTTPCLRFPRCACRVPFPSTFPPALPGTQTWHEKMMRYQAQGVFFKVMIWFPLSCCQHLLNLLCMEQGSSYLVWHEHCSLNKHLSFKDVNGFLVLKWKHFLSLKVSFSGWKRIHSKTKAPVLLLIVHHEGEAYLPGQLSGGGDAETGGGAMNPYMIQMYDSSNATLNIAISCHVIHPDDISFNQHLWWPTSLYCMGSCLRIFTTSKSSIGHFGHSHSSSSKFEHCAEPKWTVTALVSRFVFANLAGSRQGNWCTGSTHLMTSAVQLQQCNICSTQIKLNITGHQLSQVLPSNIQHTLSHHQICSSSFPMPIATICQLQGFALWVSQSHQFPGHLRHQCQGRDAQGTWAFLHVQVWTFGAW